MFRFIYCLLGRPATCQSTFLRVPTKGCVQNRSAGYKIDRVCVDMHQYSTEKYESVFACETGRAVLHISQTTYIRCLSACYNYEFKDFLAYRKFFFKI
ncbi:uncharacterized protein H6S33_010400 [Morchella sextelata]|uniref:uncharacterized protein n=1 Tax=Morchella sextelata TaxID=1174677 RepID=UPI001D04182C|nr:uncharacterized protein H6S33_010400 [Morchella sextelata]KAH0612348.1 hypothetical protein H6S33_010400 [Morchella sextelata]